MGYFSNLAIERMESNHDPYWPSKQRALLDRLEDLESRRRELIECSINKREKWGLSDSDLRYVLPGDIFTVQEVNRAITIAEGDFWKSLGIRWGLYSDEFAEEPKKDEMFNIPGQITIHQYLKEVQRAA